MKSEITTDEHLAVGPHGEMYGHEAVISLSDYHSMNPSGKPDVKHTILFACLDCGYTTPDNRMLLHVDCERESNPIAQTLREYLDAEGGL